MSQGDLVVANANGATFRSDMNDQLMALGTLSSGSSEPSTTYAYQLWADTTNDLLKIRNGANNAWVSLGDLTATNLAHAALASPTFTGTVTTPELSVSGNSRLKLPAGTTAQRPGSPATGDTRVNTTLSQVEAYDGSSWINLGGGTPTGAVFALATTTVPTGYLECNGAAVSRSTYATLFSTIGTTWGSGDGSSTFNLPDTRAEFIRGWDNSRGVDSGRSFATAQGFAMENITGSIDHISESFSSNASSSGSSALYKSATGPSDGNTPGSPDTNNTGTLAFDASRSVTTASETRPRNIAMMYVIKT